MDYDLQRDPRLENVDNELVEIVFELCSTSLGRSSQGPPPSLSHLLLVLRHGLHKQVLKLFGSALPRMPFHCFLRSAPQALPQLWAIPRTASWKRSKLLRIRWLH